MEEGAVLQGELCMGKESADSLKDGTTRLGRMERSIPIIEEAVKQ
jgi:hypothetical protein